MAAAALWGVAWTQTAPVPNGVMAEHALNQMTVPETSTAVASGFVMEAIVERPAMRRMKAPPVRAT